VGRSPKHGAAVEFPYGRQFTRNPASISATRAYSVSLTPELNRRTVSFILGESQTMESAIPQHLQRQRTRHRRISDDYNPPYPSIVARFDPTLTHVVMAYFGVQYTNKSDSNGRMKALASSVPTPGDASRMSDRRFGQNLRRLGELCMTRRPWMP